MAMTYLQLANRLIQKAGISGGALSTCQGQTGEPGRVVSWIDEAWVDIQEIHPNWDWMRRDVTFNTTASKSSYTPTECGVSDLGTWDLDTFRTYITSVGVASETFLGKIAYGHFRDTYQYGNMRNVVGRPIAITSNPKDLSLILGLTPDNTYTVVGQYYQEPQHLSADSDTPAFPSKYHMLVVYRAMMYYGSYEAASEVYQEGKTNYDALVRKLNNEQLQDVTVGGL